MSFTSAFILLSAVASILAIPLAVYLARRYAQRRKLLVYRSYPAFLPLVSAKSLKNYSLSLVFQPEGQPEERIQSGFVHFVGFANLGRDPIWRAEIAPANPLQLQVKGARVLDVALEAVHRPVSNIRVAADLDVQDGTTTAEIDFDFLDYQDGGLVRILTTARPEDISLIGDIVGMPSGIVDCNEPARSLRAKLEPWLVVSLFLISLGLIPLIVRWVTGSWSDVWILALPVLAVGVPILITLLVSATVWPKAPELPRELIPRRWRHLPPPVYMDQMYFEAGPLELDLETGELAEAGVDADSPRPAKVGEDHE